MLSTHAMLSAALEVPELELEEKEAGAIAQSLVEVQRFYPVGIDEKTLAWINLITVLGGVYGTRYAAVRVRKKREKEEARQRRENRAASPLHMIGPEMPAAGNG